MGIFLAYHQVILFEVLVGLGFLSCGLSESRFIVAHGRFDSEIVVGNVC